MRKILSIFFIIMIFVSCGNDNSATSSNQEEGTLFTGYVPGKKSDVDVGSSYTENNNNEIQGITYETDNDEIAISQEDVQIIENQVVVGLVGNKDLDKKQITLSFSFFKSATYPKTFHLTLGNPTNDEATIFYQESVSGNGTDYINLIKDGLLVIDKFNTNSIEGEFWAKLGMQSGKEVYLKNGKIYLIRGN